MKQFVVVFAAILTFTFVQTAQADDAEDAKVEKEMSKIAQLGQGVHNIRENKQGRIESCIIVGQSRISTVLGKAKGMEIARQKVKLAAKSELVEFLKSKVSPYMSEEGETILLLEGSKDRDAKVEKQSGKAVEKSNSKMESIAEGMVRGIQILHTEVNGKDETLTIVYGWDAKTSEATKKVRKDLDSDEKETDSTKTDAIKGDPKSKTDKGIEDRKATSKDAKKFLKD